MKHVAAGLLAFVFVTSPFARAQKCTGDETKNLYIAAIDTMCALDYMQSLTNSRSPSPKKECGFNYSALALGGSGLGAASKFAEFKLDNPKPRAFVGETYVTIKNTPEARASFEKIGEHFIKIDNSNQNFKSLAEDMKAHRNYHYRAMYIDVADEAKRPPFVIERGHHKALYTATKLGSRIGYLTMGLGLAGLTISAADFAFSSTPTACAEIKHRFVTTDPMDNCKPVLVLGPQTLSFLYLPADQQNQILKDNPALCEVYRKTAEKVRDNLRTALGSIGTDVTCAGGQPVATVRLYPEGVTRTTLNGLRGKIEQDGTSYDVEYTRSEQGRLGIKSITGRVALTDGGAGAPPFKVNFPLKSVRDADSKQNQEAIQMIGKVTMAMEMNGAFEKNCANQSTESPATHR